MQKNSTLKVFLAFFLIVGMISTVYAASTIDASQISATTPTTVSKLPSTNPFRILLDMILDLKIKVADLFNTTSSLQKQINNISLTPGPQGIKGDTGLQGPVGPQGISGINGTNGKNGADGINGSQGLKGDTGERGIAGTNGTNGKDGINGIDGLQGAQGEKGDKGDAGLQGLQGEQGLKGDKGDIGLQGLAGPTKNLTSFTVGGSVSYYSTICCPDDSVRTGCSGGNTGTWQYIIQPDGDQCCKITTGGLLYAYCLKYSD